MCLFGNKSFVTAAVFILQKSHKYNKMSYLMHQNAFLLNFSQSRHNSKVQGKEVSIGMCASKAYGFFLTVLVFDDRGVYFDHFCVKYL